MTVGGLSPNLVISLFAFLLQLQSRAPFGIASRLTAFRPAAHGCGCSSGVEHDLAKVGVEGSNPFARSKPPSKQQASSDAIGWTSWYYVPVSSMPLHSGKVAVLAKAPGLDWA